MREHTFRIVGNSEASSALQLERDNAQLGHLKYKSSAEIMESSTAMDRRPDTSWILEAGRSSFVRLAGMSGVAIVRCFTQEIEISGWPKISRFRSRNKMLFSAARDWSPVFFPQRKPLLRIARQRNVEGNCSKIKIRKRRHETDRVHNLLANEAQIIAEEAYKGWDVRS